MRTVKKQPLRLQIIALALLPTIIISISMAVYYSALRIKELEKDLQNRGYSLIRQLTPASKYGLYTKNIHILQGLTNAATENTALRAVTIYDKNGNVLAYAGPERLTQQERRIDTSDPNIHLTKQKNILHFTAPISVQQMNIEDGLLRAKQSNQTLKPNDILGWMSLDLARNSTLILEYQSVAINLFIVLLGIALAIILVINFDRLLLSPLQTIMKASREFSNGRTKPIKTESPNKDIRRLAQSLNRLSQQVEAGKRELNQKVFTATTELTGALQKLEQENKALDRARNDATEANRVKSEFIANMSHEIRAPMNGIIGFNNLLLETELKSHQRDYLNTVKKSADNLLAVINDILDFSKIEAGRLELDYIPLDIRECIEEVLMILAPAAHNKGIELIPIIHHNVPMKLIGDPLRIKQVITNLVSNAIKFTDEGHVVIRVAADAIEESRCQLTIKITDTGIGIKKDDLKRIFKAFHQVNNKAQKKYRGTGLGLLISKRLVQLMGGEIGVESKLHQGSTFWFSVDSDLIASGEHHFAYKRFSDMNAALYEPNALTTESFQEMFKLWNLGLTAVTDMSELLSLLQTANPNQFQLLLLDAGRADTITQFIHQILVPTTRVYHGPIVVLLNTVDQSMFNQFITKGASRCIVKPIGQKKFYHEISALLFNEHFTDPIKLEPIFQEQTHLLVIDDDQTSRRLLSRTLKNMNYKVNTTKDGNRALKLVQKVPYDLIFVDMNMPGMNGIETAMHIRQQDNLNQETPIIMMSADELTEFKTDIQTAGINDRVMKPISMNRLSQLLEKWGNTSNAPQSEQPESPIDWQECIKLANGREDLARELLDMLLEQLPDDVELINTLYQQQDLENLKAQLHKLRGALCYSGVPGLQQATAALEQAVKQADVKAVPNLYKHFEIEAERILSMSRDQLVE